MKETPILFKPEMIRAILSGQKTQTRRLMKVQPPDGRYKIATCISTTGDKRNEGKHHWMLTKPDGYTVIDGSQPYWSVPYGRKGDLLWVRETVVTLLVEDLRYKADGKWFYPSTEEERRWVWKQNTCRNIPSIHMPKWACRIWLELTADPIPQRLQEISRADAHAEGFEPGANGLESWNGRCYGNAQLAFKACIESINGPGTWEKNPWVWKLKFKRIEK